MASAFQPRVCVLDIGLPVMDGYELARHLRAMPEMPPTVRVVALTGYGQPSDRHRTTETGFDEHLVKPVDLKARSESWPERRDGAEGVQSGLLALPNSVSSATNEPSIIGPASVASSPALHLLFTSSEVSHMHRDASLSDWTPVLAIAAGVLLGCSGDIAGPSRSNHTREGDGPTLKQPEPDRTTERESTPEVSAPPAPVPGDCAPLPRRIWKLTPDQYSNAVAALVPGVSAPGRELSSTLPPREADRFSNDVERLAMSSPHVDQLATTAETVAAIGVQNPGALFPCLSSQLADDVCVRRFIDDFGLRAFRRPLSKVESDAFGAFFMKEASSGGRSVALGQLIQAFLLSPNFLYRTELGADGLPNGRVLLTPHERAAALSFGLVDAPPDAMLIQAASNGGLETSAQLQAHGRRLLATRGAKGLMSFFGEYLQVDAILGISKNTAAFKEFTPALVAAMRDEPIRFAEEVLWNADARFETLLTAGYTVANGPLAKLYGVTVSGTSFQKVSLPVGQRSGLLTEAGLLARYATADDSDIVLRGKYIRENLICQKLPAPPADVNAVFPPPDGRRTQRERLAVHSADPTCVACHKLMDPLGFALERYDAIGRHRTMEAGKVIDTTGRLVGVAGGEPTFADAIELGRTLAALPEAQQCFTRSLLSYFSGVAAGRLDQCRVQRAAARFAAGNGNVLDATAALFADGDFLVRTN